MWLGDKISALLILSLLEHDFVSVREQNARKNFKLDAKLLKLKFIFWHKYGEFYTLTP